MKININACYVREGRGIARLDRRIAWSLAISRYGPEQWRDRKEGPGFEIKGLAEKNVPS